MLKRRFRLGDRKTIAHIYRRSPIKHARHLNLRCMPNNLGCPRMVVVVGTKVSKKATLRNRLRRRLSGLIRQNFIEKLKNYDIIISVQTDVSTQSSQDLSSQLGALFEQADLLR